MDNQENENQNPPGEETAVTDTPEQEQDYTYFNVMPKDRAKGPFVTSKTDAPIPSLTDPAIIQQASDRSKKRLRLIIIGAVILIFLGLIGAGIFVFRGKIKIKLPFLTKSDQSQTPGLKPYNPNAAPPAKPNATTTPLAAGFTTPQSWRDKYFPGCSNVNICGDSADPDLDGLTNLEEFQKGTDPNNADSDQDGLADGDEVHIFGSNPLNNHTANNAKFSDADYAKGGYDFITGKKETAQQLASITQKMRTFGLHLPTLTTLSGVLNTLYDFSPGNSTSTPSSIINNASTSTSTLSGLDQSPAAKQDRDTKRSDTIKNIELALVKYQTTIGTYPATNDFNTMVGTIRPYLKIATNPVDPINQPPYVYTYAANASSSDFTLTFYSETQGTLISKNAAAAQKDAAKEQADIYDNQRENDLQNLRTALLIYSQKNVAGNENYVFPPKDKYPSVLLPDDIDQIPKDPRTGQDYLYDVSANFNSFTLKATLDDPEIGTTGYQCNQDECTSY